MENYWIHKDDCEIVRPDSTYDIRLDGHVVVMNCDGERVFTVPESWTDEQVWECIRIANYAHSQGFESGMRSKAREIRKTLYLDK